MITTETPPMMTFEEHEDAMAINRAIGIGIKVVALTEAGIAAGELASNNIGLGIAAGIGSLACVGANWFNNKLRRFGQTIMYKPPVCEQEAQYHGSSLQMRG